MVEHLPRITFRYAMKRTDRNALGEVHSPNALGEGLPTPPHSSLHRILTRRVPAIKTIDSFQGLPDLSE